MEASQPADIYREHLRKRQQRLQKLGRWDQRISTVRGLAFFSFLALIWRFYAGDNIPEYSIAIPLGLFVLLVVAHLKLREYK